MKATIAYLSVVVIIMVALSQNAYASTQPDITIRVDNEIFNWQWFVEQPNFLDYPAIINGRVLLPIDAVAYITDTVRQITPIGTVSLHDAQRGVSLALGQYQLFFARWGEYHFNVDLDVAPQLVRGSFLIPLRAVAEVFGMDVYWCSLTYTVDVFTNIEHILFHTWPINSSNWPEHLPRHEAGSVTLRHETQFVDFFQHHEFPLEFRFAFYDIPAPFFDFVRPHEAVWRPLDRMQTMRFMYFIKDNNITREVFDDVVEQIRVINGERVARGFALTEEHEIPNGDIIFTFDMDIIRYFYRRE